MNSPYTAGTQGCREKAAGSSWCRLRGASDSGHLIEGSSRARLAVSIFKTIPRGRNYFPDKSTEGRGLKPPPHERHAGRCGFKPTLWLQSPCVQTYVIVVWGYHCLGSLSSLMHQERHGTSSCLRSKDIVPASSVGLLCPTGAGRGIQVSPHTRQPWRLDAWEIITDVTPLPTLSVLSQPYRPGTSSNRVLAGPRAPNSWWVMCTLLAITALAGL